MAIYCRSSGSLSSTLILCYSKYSSATQKFHAPWQSSVKTFGESRRCYHLSLRNHSRRKVQETANEKKGESSSIMDIIAVRKNVATRSMLVYVKTKKHIPELHSVCSNFGNVENMYQYQTQDNQDFVLVEFRNSVAFNAAKNNALQRSETLVPSCIYNFHCNQSKESQQKDSSMSHVPLITHHRRMESTALNELKKISATRKSVSEQIAEHYELMRLKPVDEKLRYFVLCQIEEALSIINPQIRVLPFGSTVNGFGKYNSDLDLVLITQSLAEKRKSKGSFLSIRGTHSEDKRLKLKTSLHLVAEVIPIVIPGIKNMCEILSARVPIIKFKHSPTDLSCDLTVNQRAGVIMSELLHVFGEFDARVRPLVLFIREWARRREVTNVHPGQWITNFSLSLLLLFYLQTIKLLPSLQTLMAYARYCDTMVGDGGVPYAFLRRPELFPSSYLVKGKQSLEELLLGFFEYYSNFNFEKYSVCLQTGEPRVRTENGPLFINNPFDIDVNVTKNVSGVRLKILKKQFEDSANIINLKDKTVYENLLLLNGTPTQNIRQPLTDIDVNDMKVVEESSECL